MATALDLFKQADLSSILNPAMIGAGIGGLGYGASSYLNDDEEDTSTKLKNSLMSALKGAGIGGLAGAGYGAGKELFSQITAPKDEVGQLLAKNPGLDASPHGKNHFFEAMAGNAASSPYAFTGAGAAAGLAKTYASRAAGKEVYDGVRAGDLFKGKNPPSVVDQARDLEGSRSRMTGGDGKSFLSKLFDSGKNMTKDNDLARTEAMKHLIKGNDQAIFPQNYGQQSAMSPGTPNPLGNSTPPGVNPAPGSTQASHAKIREMLGADNVSKAPAPTGVLDKLRGLFGGSPSSPHTAQHAKTQQILKELGSPKLTALKQYGAGAAKGGLLGAGAYTAANAGMKGYFNAKYDDDQLKLWNELAK